MKHFLDIPGPSTGATDPLREPAWLFGSTLCGGWREIKVEAGLAGGFWGVEGGVLW